MKERGKGLEVYSSFNINSELFAESSSSSDFPCKRHPQSSSSVGICAYCLKDRLVNLVCSDCGEQRLSSCSCSEISSNRNSCTVDVGSVGRVSFLIENDKQSESNTGTKTGGGGGGGGGVSVAEEVLLFKRSNSSCVEIKKKNGLWRIGRLFRKSKRESSNKECGKSVIGDEKSEMWVVDYMGVSRSRSLCSFRGNGLFGSEDGGDLMSYSGARSSISAARSSGVNLFDPERRSGFSESEPRKSGFDSDQNQKRDSTVAESELLPNDFKNRRIFSLKETYFSGGDESGFIDLKFDFPSEAPSGGDFPYFGGRGGDFGTGHDQCHGGSCRITVNDRGIKKSRKSFKGWRWIFKHHPNWISGRKKDEDVMVNP